MKKWSHQAILNLKSTIEFKMIFDHINNIETYKGLSPDIYEGLKFLLQAFLDIAVGT